MKEARTWYVLAISVLFLLLSVPLFVMSSKGGREEGDLTVRWASPKGVRFKDLSSGDELDIEFRADGNLSVYLLTWDEADELRSPSYYKEPIAEPYFNGTDGRFLLVVPAEGDYEVLFWNESFRKDHSVWYSIELKSERVDRFMAFMVITGIFFVLISAAGLSVFLVLRIRERRRKGPDKLGHEPK